MLNIFVMKCVRPADVQEYYFHQNKYILEDVLTSIPSAFPGHPRGISLNKFMVPILNETDGCLTDNFTKNNNFFLIFC